MPDCLNGEDEQNCNEIDTTQTANESTEESTVVVQSSSSTTSSKADTTTASIENVTEAKDKECSQFQCG